VDERKLFRLIDKNGAADKVQCSAKSKQIDRIKAEQAMPFVEGKSGNPRGRPVGARGKKTLAREAALRAEAEAKVRRTKWPRLGRTGGRTQTWPGAGEIARAWKSAAEVAAFSGVDAMAVMEALRLIGCDDFAELDAADELL
jgi:hypothetical protein